jgi:hypothetical protein
MKLSLLSCLFLIPVFANSQDSTSHRHELIVKINPGLAYTEEGLELQYNFTNYWGIMTGGGYNIDFINNEAHNIKSSSILSTGGNGFTGRLAIIKYFGKKRNKFISVQAFYRVWKINATGYDVGTGPFSFSDVWDEVVNPVYSLSQYIDEGQPLSLYSASVKVFCADIIKGVQYRKRHFDFEFYYGFGVRYKTMNMEEMGWYEVYNYTPAFYFPIRPVYANNVVIYPDLKIGFTLGYSIL